MLTLPVYKCKNSFYLLLTLESIFFVIDSSTLAGDLQRILFTMRELDERAQGEYFFFHFFFFYSSTLIH